MLLQTRRKSSVKRKERSSARLQLMNLNRPNRRLLTGILNMKRRGSNLREVNIPVAAGIT